MESLGFSETRLDTSARRVPSRQQTALVSTRPVAHGKHVRTVEEIWDTTELHTNSLVDWEPTATHRRLQRRFDFRWSMLVGILLVSAGAISFGYWLYQRPTQAAEDAIAKVTIDAKALQASLSDLETLVPALTAQEPAATGHTSIVLAAADAGEVLFASAADLAGIDAGKRSVAADAAGHALDASRLIGDALTYRMVLAPSLALPHLETNPALVNITSAASTFSNWRSHMTDVAVALPKGIASEVTLEFNGFVNGLESAQSAYLDSLRLGDETAATDLIAELQSRLHVIGTQLDTSMLGISESAASRLAAAYSNLADLLG